MPETEPVPQAKKSAGEAARLASAGARITSDELNISAGEAFKSRFVQRLNYVADYFNSEGYKKYKAEICDLLKDVTGKQFVFDIEGVLMSDMSDFDMGGERYYLLATKIRPLVEALIANGNDVVFWTSATLDVDNKIKEAMPVTYSGVRTINRDEFRRVMDSYRQYFEGNTTKDDVIVLLRSYCPTVTEDNFNIGVNIVTKYLDAYLDNPDGFLRSSKYPQLIISMEKGFFVDDGENYIDCAKSEGWPENRVIRIDVNSEEEQILELAKKIVSEG